MKKLLSILLAILLLCALCGCGKSSSSDYSMSYATATESAMEAPYPAVGNSAKAYSEEYSGGTEADTAGSELPAIDPEKIIYSADATVETTDFDATIDALNRLVAQYGGFIQSSSISGNNYYSSSRGYASTRSAQYVIRIPSADFSTVMNSLSSLGNVPYTYTYTENITSQYYDTQARLDAYKAQEASLLAMLEKAETIEDIIKIEDKLSDVRYSIESLQTTLNSWDRQVSYSTISLDINEVTVYTPAAKVSFGQKLANAFKTGFSAVGSFFSNLTLALAEALPALVLLAAVVIAVILIIRKLRKAKRNSSDKQ